MMEGVAGNNEILDQSVDASMELYARSTTGVRLTGMINRERLSDALQDPRTITGKTAEGNDIALFVPIEYADGAGYDPRRCTEEILPPGNEAGTMVYMSSGGMLQYITDESYAEIVERIRSQESGYIFSSTQTHEDPLLSSQPELDKILSDAGLRGEAIPLLDSEAQPGNEEASISLYGLDLPKENEGLPPVPWRDSYKAYEKKVQEGKYTVDTENGTVLLRGPDISDEQAEEMWAIYQDRFQWLGKNHPVSMEDTKDEFFAVLKSPDALCSVRFKEGKPVCFMDLVGSSDSLYWLNPAFLNDKQQMGTKPNQQFVFFPGIVAGEQGANYSAEVIGLAASIAFDSGGAYKIIFENTNRSEGYIPRIVRDSILAVGNGEVGMPEPIDKTYYRCTRFSTV
jgi:hypothetical protein